MSNIINVVVRDAETPEDDIIVPDTGWYTSSTESNSSTGSSFVAPFIGIGVISFAILVLLILAKRKLKTSLKCFGLLSTLAVLVMGASIYGAITNVVSATDNLISITSSDTTITVVRGTAGEEGTEADTTYGVATATIKLNETTPLGYTIFAYAPDGNILRADTGDGTIEPVTINNSALTNNTWGIALTDQADIKAEDTIWNKLEDESSPLLVASFDESTTAGTTVTLRYGVLVDNTLPVGVYSANIEYKAYQRAYNITFDPGEGEITTPTKPVIIGEPIGELPTPVRTNYNFLGWYTEETGGTKIDENTVPDQNSTYFAHWERITYSITFNPGEGTIISGDATKTVQAGEPLGTLPEVARDNYTFTGWYTQETGGERVTTATIPTEGTSYYAHWSRDTYTITFNAREGTIAPQDAERSINAGDAIGTLPDATRTNYTLDGWYTAETGGIKITAETTPTGTTTYYAHWNRIEYTITYNLMGGNISGDTTNPTATVQAGDTLGNLPTEPTKENHTFAGWYTAETGGDPVTTETRPDGTTTYYAQWELACNDNATTVGTGNVATDAVCMQDIDQNNYASIHASMTTGTQYKLFDNRDEKIYFIAKQADNKIWMTQNLDLCIGCEGTAALTSENTNLKVSGSGIYVDGYTVEGGVITWTPIAAGRTGTINDYTESYNEPRSANRGDTYIYTSGSNTMYDITYESLSDCVTAGHTEDECKHYYVGGYYNSSSAIASNDSTNFSTKYANAENSICPAGWRLPKGRDTDVTAENTEFGELLRASGFTETRLSSVFKEGGFNAIRDNPVYLARFGMAAAHRLTNESAGYYWSSTNYSSYVWHNISFYNSSFLQTTATSVGSNGENVRCVVDAPINTITFDANGGIVDGGNTTTREITARNRIGTLPEATKDEYNLDGWYTAAEGGNKISENTVPDGTTTYYAHWNRIEYTITFDLNGGNISGDTTNPTATVQSGDALGTLPTEPSRTNYAFAGWYTQLDGGTQIDINTIPAGTTTYYAHWTVASITVTFNANGGTLVGGGSTTTRDVNAGSPLGVLPEVTRDEYTLAGWYTDANGGVRVTPDSIPSDGDTYYAHWEENNFPKVWSHDGACTFNASVSSNKTSSSPLGLTGDQCDYAGQDYIDTGIQLYSNTNHGKDYEIGFTIESYDPGENVKQATFMNTKLEGNSYPGAVVRRYDLNNNIDISSRNTSSANERKFVNVNTPMTIRLVRKDSISNPGYKAIYYAIDDDELTEINDLSNFDPEFNLNVWFGATPTNASATSAQRYLNGVMSNMYIRLGEYNEGSADTYTINFNAQGGTTLEPTRTIIAGYKLDTLPAPTRAGYVFDGWYTQESGGTKISANTVPSGGTTYYARWISKYTIIYNANGRTFTDDSTINQVEYTGSTATGIYKEPVGTNTYMFMGWGTASTDTSATYTSEEQVKSYYSANPGQTVTLYAVWANALTISFDGNGSTEGTMDTIYVPANTTQTLPANAFAKDGYVFMNWSTNDDGTGTTYNNEGSITVGAVTPGDTLTLYANWEKATSFDDAYAAAGKSKDATSDKYKMHEMTPAICEAVTTDQVGELVDARDGTVYNVGKLADGRCWFLDNLALDAVASKSNLTPENTNASQTAINNFITGSGTAPQAGWATTAVSYETSSSVYDQPRINTGSINAVPQGNDPLASTALAEDWKSGVYYNYCAASIGTYCYTDGSGVDTDATSAIDVKNDICPAGWRMPTGGAISSTGTTTGGGEYQALYNAYPAISDGDDQYTRFRKSFRLPLSGNFNYGSLYGQGRFAGVWSSTFYDVYAMYGLYAKTSSITPQKDIGRNYGFSVRCVADNVTKNLITFNANGGIVDGGSTIDYKVTEGQALGTLPEATRDGYTFDGWYTQMDGGEEVTAQTVPAGAITYYAHWSVAPTTFDDAYAAAGKSREATSGKYKLQDINKSICDAVSVSTKNDYSDTQETQLVDIRDGKTYWVAKLLDGKCWMTQNLDLNLGSTLTSENTDLNTYGSDGYDSSHGYSQNANNVIAWTPERSTISSSRISSSGTISGWANSDSYPYSVDVGNWHWIGNWKNDEVDTWYTSEANNYLAGDVGDPVKYQKNQSFSGNDTHGRIGNYYNWSATIASNASYYHNVNTYYDLTSSPKNSICPAGWRLPITSDTEYVGGLANEFKSLITLYGNTTSDDRVLTAYPLWFVRGGGIYSGSLTGSGGNYWSSTVDGTDYAYAFGFSSSNVYFSYSNKLYGRSVRCVTRSPSIISFDASGGIVDGNSITTHEVSEGNMLGVLPEAIRGGYTFDGWYTEETGGSIITAGTIPETDTTYYAHWSVTPTTFDDAYAAAGLSRDDASKKYKMNEMTSSICDTITIGETGELVDIRDDNVYNVGKLADGHCWLLDNLALNLLNSSVKSKLDGNTNAPTSAINALLNGGRVSGDSTTNNLATAGVANWNSIRYQSYSAPLINVSKITAVPSTDDSGADEPMAAEAIAGNWKVGVYYNYCAASAGTYCYGDNDSVNYGTPLNRPNTAIDAEYDICPSGWRMPTGYRKTNGMDGDSPDGGEYHSLVNAYPTIVGGNSQYIRIRSALHLPLSGEFYDSPKYTMGGRGSFWSSTYRHYNDMYYLGANHDSIIPLAGSGTRYVGLSVRCIAK